MLVLLFCCRRSRGNMQTSCAVCPFVPFSAKVSRAGCPILPPKFAHTRTLEMKTAREKSHRKAARSSSPLQVTMRQMRLPVQKCDDLEEDRLGFFFPFSPIIGVGGRHWMTSHLVDP